MFNKVKICVKGCYCYIIILLVSQTLWYISLSNNNVIVKNIKSSSTSNPMNLERIIAWIKVENFELIPFFGAATILI